MSPTEKGTRIEDFATKVLKSRRAIIVNDRLMKGLGYTDTRSFFEVLGNWGYNTDFNTISPAAEDRTQSYLRAFVRSFLD